MSDVVIFLAEPDAVVYIPVSGIACRNEGRGAFAELHRNVSTRLAFDCPTKSKPGSSSITHNVEDNDCNDQGRSSNFEVVRPEAVV